MTDNHAKRNFLDTILDKAEDGMSILETTLKDVPEPDTEVIDAEFVDHKDREQHLTTTAKNIMLRKLVRLEVLALITEHRTKIVKSCMIDGSHDDVQKEIDSLLLDVKDWAR